MPRLAIASILLAIMLAGCRDNRLATELKGSWSGATEQLAAPGIASASFTPVYTFYNDTDSSAASGEITVAAMLSAIIPDSPSDNAIQPVQTSVSGVGTISGTWDLDGERVTINLDPSTLSVNINPSSIVSVDDLATQTDTPVLAPLSAESASTLEQSLAEALKMRFVMLKSFDDLNIEGDMLHCTAMERHTILRRSMPAF